VTATADYFKEKKNGFVNLADREAGDSHHANGIVLFKIIGCP
jgi:hypothetical protein